MGQAIPITRHDHSAAELRKLAGESDDAEVVRRLLAIAMVLDGCCRTEAAGNNGMDRQTLCDWVHRYNTEGVAGLKSRKSPGRPPALNKEQMQEFKTLVVNGPDVQKHKVVRWRCCDLREEIAAVTRLTCTSGRSANCCVGSGSPGCSRVRRIRRKTLRLRSFLKKLCRCNHRRHTGGGGRQTNRDLVQRRSQGRAEGHSYLHLGASRLASRDGAGQPA